jgi:hypothetical protein
MILKNEKPLSSLVERKKTEHLKIEYNPIRIPCYEDMCIIKGAYRARPIFIRGPNLAPHRLDSRGPIQALPSAKVLED